MPLSAEAPSVLDAQYSAHGFHARICGPQELLAGLHGVLPLALDAEVAGDGQTTTYEVRRDASSGYCQLLREGYLLQAVSEGELLAFLEWHVINDAVEHLSHDWLLLHAGALSKAGTGLLLPAVSGSGKSTLTLALLGEGFLLCSDELACIDPYTLELSPFPRNPCIKGDTLEILRPYLPWVDAAVTSAEFLGRKVSYISVSTGAWASSPVRVTSLVVPQYTPGSRPALENVSRSEVIALLLAQSFTVRALGERGVSATVELLRGVDCYRLQYSDLRDAVALIRLICGG